MSAFQQECIVDIEHFVTLWRMIAGAGKTLMLLRAAKMMALHNPNTVVWFVASTNRVAAEFEEFACQNFEEEEMLPLRVVATDSGV